MKASKSDIDVVWKPQEGPQTAFVHCTFADEILFGGARGGGKTDSALGKLLIKALQYGAGVRAIFFRRTLPELEEVVLRSHELYRYYGKYNFSSKTWRFDNGARIQFRFLDRDEDASLYQGRSLTDVVIEEAGSFPSISPILKLKACLRSAKGVPCQLLLTANPGGVGQHWLKARYIDPAPPWTPIKEVDERTGTVSTRIYIPSKVTDNKILLENDPTYISRLAQSGSEALVRAWLDGDWNVVDGAFFDCWDPNKHVIQPCTIKPYFTRLRMMDWGSAKPFGVLWGAVSSENWNHPKTGQFFPKDSMIIYRELYGIKKKIDGSIMPNVGVKMFAEQVGKLIVEAEKGDRVDFGVLDPSAFAVDGGPSIAERMYMSTSGRVAFRRADNKRVGALGALSGWDQIRSRLVGEENPGSGIKGNIPMLYVMSNCHHLIRTLPSMEHDPDRPEDLRTDSEDHLVDALRYGCMSRPYTRPVPAEQQKPKTLKDITLDELWDNAEQMQLGADYI